jgi:Leucine-rich repeat (LRR) protein
VCVLLTTANVSLQAQQNNLELGIRYLKLGNTYREARDYERAETNLLKGLEMVTANNSVYWEAAAYEFMGYMYRDQGLAPEARSYLQKAQELFSQVIAQEGGSNEALPKAMNSLDDPTRMNAPSNDMLMSDSTEAMRNENTQTLNNLRRKIDEVSEENRRLMQENEALRNGGLPFTAGFSNDNKQEDIVYKLQQENRFLRESVDTLQVQVATMTDIIRNIHQKEPVLKEQLSLADIENLPEYTDFTEALREPQNVRNLRIDNNKDFENFLALVSQFTNLTRLDVRSMGLLAVPESLFELYSLEVLVLEDNRLLQIPPQVETLQYLRAIDLSGNDLSSLPQELFMLPNIEILDLEDNRLRSLPMELSRMPRLRKLYLENNQLQSLPNGMERLSRMEKLTIGGNDIADAEIEYIFEILPTTDIDD